MAGKFELKKSKSGKYMFNLVASNGRVILTSEMYNDKAGAKNGIESVRKHAGDDANFERKTSSSGAPFFALKASNGQTIGMSEMYSKAASMENGVASVKKNAPDAAVTDLTEE
jgi:uncharacterized protein